MRCAVALAFSAVLCAAAPVDPPSAKAKAAKSTTTSVHKSAVVHKGTVAHPAGRRLVHGRWVKTSRRSVAHAPAYQLHPDPERYQEIQKALADKGYFKGDPDGKWNDDSVNALKRFQTDQNLPAQDGKINALTLIGLGLGPKHDGKTASN